MITIAENMLTNIPIAKVKANPRIMLEPNQNKIPLVIKVEMLLSRIDGQAREKPSSKLANKLLPFFDSSLILSKTKTFASTAIPIVMTNPAMPERVRVTGINLKIAKTIIA